MLKILARIIMIGANENNVKKAVALARMSGSLRLSCRKAFLNMTGICFIFVAMSLIGPDSKIK